MNAAAAKPVATIRSPKELFPEAWFSVEVEHARGDERWLLPSEHALVVRAVPQRRAEFAAGRHCARRALARLSVAPVPLLRDEQGCPLWPRGTSGSISHTSGCVVSVAARCDGVSAVGVDVERIDAAAAEAITAQVCSDAERNALMALPWAERAPYACALFSVKETIYKCVYAATGERLTFSDAAVWLDFRQGLFLATLQRPVGRGLDRRDHVVGRVGRNDHYVFSGQYWLARRCDPVSSPISP